MDSNEIKPLVEFVSSTRDSVTIKWKLESNAISVSDPTYRVQVEDRLYRWITKYWGKSVVFTIADLAPQSIYTVRVGVTANAVQETWSDSMTVATQADKKWTFFMFKAIDTSNIKQLQSFISERKQAINSINRFGETPLIQAARLGDVKCAQLILAAGADPNCVMHPSMQTPLMAACFAGHAEMANMLADSGAGWTYRDVCGRDALHYAVSNSQVQTIGTAIDGGCEINSRDNYHWTPLMRAVIVGASKETLTKLIGCGANIELTDRNHQSSLDLAKQYRDENIVLLINKCEKEIIQKENN